MFQIQCLFSNNNEQKIYIQCFKVSDNLNVMFIYAGEYVESEKKKKKKENIDKHHYNPTTIF